MKIKRILSLVCSAALVATALSTGAIITKADEQQSEPIRVDFSSYKQVDYDGKNDNAANMNYTPWGINTCSIKTGDNNNKYFNFTKTNSKSAGAFSTTFLVDPKGEHGSTRLESNTTYNLTVKYKFNKLDISENQDDTIPDKLCPYIGFKNSNEYKTQPDDSGVVNPVSGLWTKYGYYVNVMNSTKAIKGGIGMGSIETANGADVWKTFNTDNNGWTTGTLSFTTNNVEGKDMYFGFTTGCYGIGCVATIDYDIDYIEIAKASADDPDAYAKNANTYLDFSAYKYKSDDNIGKHVAIVDSKDILGVNGKIAHIKAEGEAENYSTNFRVSLTNQNYPMGKLLTADKTYQLEIRYKYNSCSTDLGALISFGDSFWKDLTGKQLFGSEGNKISKANPTGSFWDEAVEDENGWVTAKLNFKAPTNIGNSYMYFMFADNENGLTKGTSIDMYIDYINVRLAAPVTINGYPEAAFGVPGDSMAALAKDAKKENYETGSAKAIATETTYYSDGACENKIDLTTEKYGAVNTLYLKDKTVVDTESQAAFCGFDEYKLRTYKDEFGTKDNWTFYDGVTGAAGYNANSFSITSADSYTGTKSLLYNYKNVSTGGTSTDDAYAKVAYIGNGYDLIPGKTYELSFWYKPAAGNEADTATFMFTSGKTWLSYAQSSTFKEQEVTGLKSQNVWKQVKLLWECKVTKNGKLFDDKAKELSWCAPVLKLRTTDDQTAIYFDSFVISEVATYDGAAKLNIVDNDGKQAIRFKYSYDTVAGAADNTVKIAGETYTVAERGILVKSANNSANLVRNTTANGVMKAVKTDKFEECWNYNAETGKYEFSMYIKGLDENDTRELVSRAYVVLKDIDGNETVFYSETSTTSVEKITRIIES